MNDDDIIDSFTADEARERVQGVAEEETRNAWKDLWFAIDNQVKAKNFECHKYMNQTHAQKFKPILTDMGYKVYATTNQLSVYWSEKT